ncbi:hypothetical protein HK096_000253 [Nowakowskiella sp. JEL0078]|nr:hypothetical protein HK096_000253 [Nowakowskiella sp. JEL0078]
MMGDLKVENGMKEQETLTPGEDKDIDLEDVQSHKGSKDLEKIDSKKAFREKNTPFLIQTWCTTGPHQNPENFKPGFLPPRPITIHTWKDATLRELTFQLRAPPSSRISFRVICHDRKSHLGAYLHARDLGVVGLRRDTESKTLEDLHFKVGDYLDVAFLDEGPSLGRGPIRRPLDAAPRGERFQPYSRDRKIPEFRDRLGDRERGVVGGGRARDREVGRRRVEDRRDWRGR